MKVTSLLPLLFSTACVTSTHPTEPSKLGVARALPDLLAVIDQPGPIDFETIASADWAVSRAGMINLDHPAAEAAGLEDGDEPIQIFFHVVKHPQRGTFIIDTGVQNAFRDDRDNALLTGLVASAMNVDALKVKLPLGDWIAKQGSPLAGVFLTHIHADHILGLPDVPRGTPLHLGAGETAPRAFMNIFAQGVTDDALEGHVALSEWRGALVDIFGDGSVWAIAAPGHTPGSTAYLVRTTRGPVLIAGDACHTQWGWEHDVEPGEFSLDLPQSRDSLAMLRKLVADHPAITVKLGHQALASASDGR